MSKSSFDFNLNLDLNIQELSRQIKTWGLELGFNQIGITDLDVSNYSENLKTWLKNQFHGNMNYMERHLDLRLKPDKLQPGALRAIMARIDYLPSSPNLNNPYQNPNLANISRYAHHKDYHKIIRKKLQKLANKINIFLDQSQINLSQKHSYRAFSDSAPILEKPLAQKSGLGWQGKHTNLIHPKSGSWFFLGSLLTNLPLNIDPPFEKTHCGSCSACIQSCPTGAIIAPFKLDARRCISYLTIELKSDIPIEFRALIGNRVYGCDDCQLVCPWNKFAKPTEEMGFESKKGLDNIELLKCFEWSEKDFLKHTEGSPIRRIGYQCWLRNMAVGLGNALNNKNITSDQKQNILNSLNHKYLQPDEIISPMVKRHIEWALDKIK